MLDAKTIVLEYVCPALGVVTANQMFYAPYQDVQKAIRRGSLGDLNPLPWAFMLGNCCGWCFYALLIDNKFIFFANTQGILLSLWFNLAASKLLFQQQFVDHNNAIATERLLAVPTTTAAAENGRVQHLPTTMEVAETDGIMKATTAPALLLSPPTSTTTPASQEQLIPTTTTYSSSIIVPYYSPPQHDYWVMGMSLFWLILITIIGFGHSFSPDTKEWIIGVVVNLNLVFFYGAPLSTIWTVLKTQNSASIHIGTMLTNTANGVFWTAYGIAVVDWFVIVPNGLGALLGVIQMVLCVIFPRRPVLLETTAAMESETILATSAINHTHTMNGTATVKVDPMRAAAASTNPLVESNGPSHQQQQPLITPAAIDDEEAGTMSMVSLASGQTVPLEMSETILSVPFTSSSTPLVVDDKVKVG